jgi:hypothetical protein
MKRVVVASTVAGLAIGVAGLLLWPRSEPSAQPQVNAEGCTCSRPTVAGSGREQLSLYYCACPGMQCMVTATTGSSSMPPNVVQSCRSDLQQSQIIPSR